MVFILFDKIICDKWNSSKVKGKKGEGGNLILGIIAPGVCYGPEMSMLTTTKPLQKLRGKSHRHILYISVLWISRLVGCLSWPISISFAHRCFDSSCAFNLCLGLQVAEEEVLFPLGRNRSVQLIKSYQCLETINDNSTTLCCMCRATHTHHLWHVPYHFGNCTIPQVVLYSDIGENWWQ
jgi:hypothetical protein